MKKKINILLIAISSMFLFSCGSSRKITYYKRTNSHINYSKNYKNYSTKTYNSNNYNSKTTDSSTSKSVGKVLRTAKSYIGTPYRYGGTTRTGLDCSGLVYLSFLNANIKMPRVSTDQANSGKKVDLKNVKTGDLIFFNTSGHSISHVGIVESVNGDGTIKFIHSSTSRGVMISSLDENYWKSRFVKAVRLL